MSYAHKAFPVTKHFSMHCLPKRLFSDGILQEWNEIIHRRPLEGAWASEQAHSEQQLLSSEPLTILGMRDRHLHGARFWKTGFQEKWGTCPRSQSLNLSSCMFSPFKAPSQTQFTINTKSIVKKRFFFPPLHYVTKWDSESDAPLWAFAPFWPCRSWTPSAMSVHSSLGDIHELD